jgi:SepF-like predicted cell division protein (DUF552 family)
MIEDKWYTIFIEDVMDEKAATTMLWENKYYIFNEEEEKIFTIKDYEVFIKLEDVKAGLADFSIDIVELTGLDAELNIGEEFTPDSNVSFSIDVDSKVDVVIEETLFRMNKLIWNDSTSVSGAAIFEESLGLLEEGQYYLFVKLKSGKQILELEKQFSVGKVQIPAEISSKFGLQDLLILLLVALIVAAVIIAVKSTTEKSEIEEEEETKPQAKHREKPQIKHQERSQERLQKSSQEKKQEKGLKMQASETKETEPSSKGDNLEQKGIFTKIKDAFGAMFSIAGKKQVEEETEAEKEEAGEKEEKEDSNIRKVDFVGKAGNVYLPHKHLLQLRDWLREYHAENRITLKMRRMPEIVQKLGPKIYENPKQVTRDDVVRLSQMFKEKHDYISMNDLVIGGSIVTKELKKTLGVEEEEKKKKAPVKGKLVVRFFIINKIDDVHKALESLRKGELVIVNLEPIYKSSKENLKRAVDKLKNTCDALGGDIGLTFERHLVLTPRKNITIFRRFGK